jgi:hypothetical protein
MNETYARGYVRISTGEPDYPVRLVTASEVRDVLTSRHLYCGWEVSRKGGLEPCGKDAVAIRFDETNGGVGEVCKHHAKGLLVPLEFIAWVASGLTTGAVSHV